MKVLVCLMLIGLFMGIFLQELAEAACVCNEKGRDYCQSCRERRIIRPKQKYYGDSDLNLPPIGDNCWCSKLMIEPAALPKPCSKKTPPTYKPPSCGCKNSYTDTVHYNNYPTPDVGYATGPISTSSGSAYGKSDSSTTSTKSNDPSQAADPISVSLAVQAGKAIEVPEAKLAYGFLQKPVDGLKKIYFSTVPEENLFKLNSDVITLKKSTQSSSKSAKEDEEWQLALEESEAEETDESDDENERPQLTYKQLGYVTEKFKNPKFRRITHYREEEDSDEEKEYGGRRKPVRGRGSVDCGFRPGRVSNYRKKSNDGY